MPAGKYDFVIEQGATYSVVITWKDSSGNPVDLTTYSARMKIKESKDATTELLDLTVGGGITLGGAAGTITITITATVTAALDFDTAVYDLEMTVGATITRLLEGKVTLSKEVTTA